MLYFMIAPWPYSQISGKGENTLAYLPGATLKQKKIKFYKIATRGAML